MKNLLASTYSMWMAFFASTSAHRDTFVMIAFLAAHTNRISLYIINIPDLLNLTSMDVILSLSASISIVEEIDKSNKVPGSPPSFQENTHLMIRMAKRNASANSVILSVSEESRFVIKNGEERESANSVILSVSEESRRPP